MVFGSINLLLGQKTDFSFSIETLVNILNFIRRSLNMNESNFTAYHESITAELLAGRNRVRYFIGGIHWGEDGRFKEVLLMNYLRKVLPANVSVGTGFVKNGNITTSQIDLIVYDNSIPTLFSEGDFVIALPESVLGIIEVKSKLKANINCQIAIKKANDNGFIIGKEIFNGIFSYESEINFISNVAFVNNIKDALVNNNGFLNHISFGPEFFVKYWKDGNPEESGDKKCFSFYKLKNLAFGYFISNLLEHIHVTTGKQKLSQEFQDFLYPIDGGKESRRLSELEIIIDMPVLQE